MTVLLTGECACENIRYECAVLHSMSPLMDPTETSSLINV
jgi:hypothetical protein